MTSPLTRLRDTCLSTTGLSATRFSATKAGLALGLALAAGACGSGSGQPELVLPFDSTSAEAHMPAVIEALRQGDPETALQAWDDLQAAGQLPDGAWHYRALALMDAGREEQAWDAWSEALAQHPGDGRALTFAADWLLDRGRGEQAAEYLATARRCAPDLPLLSLVSGRAALLSDDDEHAARDFRDFLEGNPFDKLASEAHHALAQIAARRGDPAAQDHERASQYLEQVHRYLSLATATLRDDPDNIDERFRIAAIFLDLFHACGDGRLPVSSVTTRQAELLAQAEDALQSVLEMQPAHARALLNLGFVRTMERRDEDAMSLYRQAIEADPEHTGARLNLARSLAARNEVDEARRLLEGVLVLTASDGDSGDRARAHTELADLDERSGNLPGAVFHLEAIIELFPGNSDATRKRRNALRLLIDQG